jgi:hypothetical protein
MAEYDWSGNTSSGSTYSWSGFDPDVISAAGGKSTSDIIDSSTGFSFKDITDNIGTKAADALAKAYKTSDGSINWKNVLATGTGLVSLYKSVGGGGGGGSGGGSGGILDNIFGSGSAPQVGYQGDIPQYTAIRAAVPDATEAAAYKPGLQGRRYFSDTYYVDKANVPTARTTAETQATGIAALQKPPVGVEPNAAGGIIGLKQGRYLNGTTDGMADKIRTSIDDKQPAALSHGEFVIPADVVSHLGNGNSEAGADRLYKMMDKIRTARTGNKKQGRQINPNKYLPA